MAKEYCGYDSLLRLLGDIKNDKEGAMEALIKKAVENSYFFDTELAKNVFKDLKTKVKKQRDLLNGSFSNIQNSYNELISKYILGECKSSALTNYVKNEPSLPTLLNGKIKKLKKSIEDFEIKSCIGLDNHLEQIFNNVNAKFKNQQSRSIKQVVYDTVKEYITNNKLSSELLNAYIESNKNSLHKLIGDNKDDDIKKSIDKFKKESCTKLYNELQTITKQINIYARKSTKKENSKNKEQQGNISQDLKSRKFYYKNEENNYFIITIDHDGNRAVRDLIKDKTGYVVSSGEKSNFFFFKISHIWGKAYNPWYFTSLWNIVIVPAWVNDLLDKNDSDDLLCKKIIATYKAICYKYYQLGKDPFKGTPIEKEISEPKPTEDYVSGEHLLTIIEEGGKKISKEKVKITIP